jgi:hypothetical protein
MMEEDGVRLARVRSPEDDEIRLLDLAIRARPAARAEYRRQTDDARRVSCTVAAVDVVAADAARELLGEIVHLVRRLRAAEKPEARWPAAFDGRTNPAGRSIERLVPRGWPQNIGVAYEWLRQPFVVSLHMVSLPRFGLDFTGPRSGAIESRDAT